MGVSRNSHSLIAGVILFAILVFTGAQANALTNGETYSVILSKLNSNGTVSEVSSTSAAADSNGKISFSFSSVPTNPDTYFLVLTIKDSSGTVVRKSFVPAPPENSSGQLGANELSTTQTDMILQALADAGTDNPIVVAYGLILTRTANLSDADVANIAIMVKAAIINGFETFLTSNGVSSAQLLTFKQKLVYNQSDKDLSNFTTLFKSAVDNPDQSSDEMAKAAGLIADIFIDAGIAAGIDLSLIQAAHDAAGYAVDNDANAATAFAALSGTTSSTIGAAMSSFFIRIAAVKVKTSYTNALNVLSASGAQVTQFNTAVQNMVTAMENIDKTYAQYFENPDLLSESIQNEMNTAYQAAFSTFQSAIADTDENIATMKTGIASAMGISEDSLPADLGTYRDYDGDTVNWPIPQVVAVNWVASILSAGGGLVYDRAAVAAEMPVPSNMSWLNGDGTRTDYAGMGMPVSFAALMGLQEDVQIAENTRWSIYGGEQPTRDEEKAAKLAFNNNIDLIISSLSGTTDGSTAISDEIKEALVKMMEHPSLN